MGAILAPIGGSLVTGLLAVYHATRQAVRGPCGPPAGPVPSLHRRETRSRMNASRTTTTCLGQSVLVGVPDRVDVAAHQC